MWFSRRQQRNSLQAPVAGTHTAMPAATSPQQVGVLAVQPTSQVINAPLDGDIISLSPSSLVINSLSGHYIELRIDTPYFQNTCDWQVRVGDSVSPLTILGTLSGALDGVTIAVYRLNRIQASGSITLASN
ncbi:hypothetical protein [Lactiplantibacillus argentoratensis]|uniref:Uncharacterized protein n=1 Tax=Lactiplantibacillus argentoratensis TaxID=271881 RepID=A0ABS5UI15_9LACO|nr:hypothetical protein [Lactiplantibacillus argentoratensis]MBT1138211.1 hypothetical protein [Lactiplantibacillus argentoratensis]MBT1141068.1 hypothetical protein [Lactiplantibacillus argentoratensis]